MRTALESIHSPAPPDLPFAQLEQELETNLGMSRDKAHAFRAAVTGKWSTCSTCGPLMLQSEQEMAQVFEVAGLSERDVATVKMCLGSATEPHKFSSGAIVKAAEPPEDVSLKKKGGSTTESQEVLRMRRPDLEAEHYFPPAQFDAHRPGAPTRNENKLRVLIVQEVSAP